MLIHSVFFWLDRSLSTERRDRFLAGVNSLAAVPGIQLFHVGTPAATGNRPVVERTYDVGLTTGFANLAAHDAYQVHPLHHAFLAAHNTDWIKVRVFDVI